MAMERKAGQGDGLAPSCFESTVIEPESRDEVEDGLLPAGLSAAAKPAGNLGPRACMAAGVPVGPETWRPCCEGVLDDIWLVSSL
mmetsp:Transcript_50158/g.155012  ORF Transcript_50158/g.155012 Transcript_50158/m.155012 type:complete len:85 (-) Transcript_50158:719-973(-)